MKNRCKYNSFSTHRRRGHYCVHTQTCICTRACVFKLKCGGKKIEVCSKLQDEPLSPATKRQSPRTHAHQQPASCVQFRLHIKCLKCVTCITSVNKGFRLSESHWRRRILPLTVTYHTRRIQLSVQLRLTLVNQSGYYCFNSPLSDRRRKAAPALLAFKRLEGGGGR